MSQDILNGIFLRWGTFRYSDIFDVKKGTRLTKADMNPGATPFVGASDSNNGITQYIDTPPQHPGNLITVSYNGSVAEAFYQEQPFCASDDINILYPKFKLDKYSALFITTVIRKEKYRYNYGRKWHKERMEQSIIKLPVDANGRVDTEGMGKLIITLNGNKTIEDNVNNAVRATQQAGILNLDVKTWESFSLNELFTITGTKTTTAQELSEYGPGDYPYVTTQATNNGIDGYYNYYTEEGGVLTVDSAVIGYCAYQEKNFSASDHVEKLIPKFPLNKYNALFLVTIMNREQYRYNYGRKSSQTRLREGSIQLPVIRSGVPDWEYVENYIKALPYSSSI